MFLAFVLLYKAEYATGSTHLFNKQNSTAMWGFWCLIVILVHIPAAYQNRIQDMIGSFAYIGVTFFFMTSAYGLKLGIKNNPESIRHFWRKRLPKLLVPMFLVNMIAILFGFMENTSVSPWILIKVNGWVWWLLVCYIIFWAVNRFLASRGGGQDIIICILITAFSVIVYFVKEHISSNTWCPEVFGFVWGIVFSNVKDKFAAWTERKWLTKSCVSCMLAGIAGAAYLKFKPVAFFGDYLLKIFLGVLIITFILVLNSHIKIENPVSLFLGGISYEVYLLHGSVFGLISYMFPRIGSGLFIICSIALTVLVSFVVGLCSNFLNQLISKSERSGVSHSEGDSCGRLDGL